MIFRVIGKNRKRMMAKDRKTNVRIQFNRRESKKTLVYPVWLQQLHERAQAKSIHLVFSNSNITQSEPRKYLSPFIEWNNSISESTTPAYNGCDIPPRLLRNFVSTFLNYGIFALSSRHGYFLCNGSGVLHENGSQFGPWRHNQGDMSNATAPMDSGHRAGLFTCSFG